MADKFNIDGLLYTDKLPHSRIERILYAILKKQGSGGDESDVDLVVDDPSDVGESLTLSNNTISVHTVKTMDDSGNPISSGAIYEQLVLAGEVMGRI